MKPPKYERELELKKHVNAVHCSNALTLVQRKLFNALLLHSYRDLSRQSQFNIPVKNLCKLIGYNSNDYASLKKALLKLMTITIEWNLIEESSVQNKGKWQASSILACATLEAGVCTYEYSSVIKELLYQPEIYARLNMSIIAKFTSGYGLALYENCIRYQGLPQTPSFAINVFRKLMGISDDKYKSFNSFKNRVLNIAVEEVNKHSHVTVFPELERRNQKVISIRFKLSPKISQTTTLAKYPNTDISKLRNELINDFHLSQKIIEQILDQYKINYIKEKINIIRQSASFQAGKINGLAGYLLDALKKDYKINQTSAHIIEKQRKKREEIETLKKQKETILREREYSYSKYVDKAIDDYIFALSTTEQKKIIDSFEDNLKQEHPFLVRFYKKYNLENPVIRGLFNQYIQERRAEEMDKILTLAEFMITSN